MPLDSNRPYPTRPRLENKDSYLGIRGYFITINCYKKKRIFIYQSVVNSMVKYLDAVSEKEEFDVVAYTFMPTHLHLVLTGRFENSDLCRFVKSYKQITGYNFKKVFGFKLWATSFHDHVLRKKENIKTVGRYVLKNPVRAGLVKSVLDYPYSGSFIYGLKELVDFDPFLDNFEDSSQA